MISFTWFVYHSFEMWKLIKPGAAGTISLIEFSRGWISSIIAWAIAIGDIFNDFASRKGNVDEISPCSGLLVRSIVLSISLD